MSLRIPFRPRLLGAVLAPALALSVAAPAALAADGADANTVEYRGTRLTVPRDWRVVDLEKTPEACLRLDRPTLYLGHAGDQTQCTGRGAAVERADTLHLEPADGTPPRADIPTVPVDSGTALPARHAEAPSNELRYDLKQPGLMATVSYGESADVPERVIETAVLGSTPRHERPRRLPSPLAGPAAAPLAQGGYQGAGFDACTAPTQSQMTAWRANSPYRAVGIYIGGEARACAQPQLSAGWVRTQAAAGWHLMPIWVGPQPWNKAHRLSTSPATAADQGRQAADGAVAAAKALGHGPGTVLYNDVENYNDRATWDKPVLSYLAAWTERLHGLGYRSGAYVAKSSGVPALSAQYGKGSYTSPDVLWSANWDGVAGVGDASMGLPQGSGQWAAQRVHQYRGDISETYGGVRLGIDRNYVDVSASAGPVGMHDLASGDFNGDGKADVIGVEQETGKLFFYPGDGKGGIGGGSTRKEIGTNWNSMRNLVAGDFDGDGKTDLLAVESGTGKLFLYPGDGSGGVGGGSTRKEIGTNWDSMQDLTAGDFNGDGKPDVVGVEQETGKLFFYAGDGKGSIGGGGTRKEIGTNWDSMQGLTAGDFDGDGKTDLLAVESGSGKLFLYPGDGSGGVGGGSTRKEIGTNWDSMRELTAGDFDGDGKTDLLAVENDTRKLFFYAGDGKGSIGGGTRKEIGTNW
ncbi:FG-GAP-like repeat-containing protein [Streptomyces varsoviensis]|uniref:FG-GAP-like repeat-containing protein n=1 Tax=Streptomyces varsoviensis TaxID=67373 RepID=UPI0033FFB5AC